MTPEEAAAAVERGEAAAVWWRREREERREARARRPVSTAARLGMATHRTPRPDDVY